MRTRIIVVYAVLFVAGMFSSMQFTALSTMAFSEIAPERRGGAAALWGMVVQDGQDAKAVSQAKQRIPALEKIAAGGKD